MGFIDSYKHLEKLCGDMLQTQHGVSAYIAEMESTPNGSYWVQGWVQDLKCLKHYRWVRNQIVHDPNSSEENMCCLSDAQWIDNFYDRILVENYGYSLDQMAQEIKVNNSQRGQGKARADIVIWKSKQDKIESKAAFIVVECKAENVRIREEDYYQGYNYASWAGASFHVRSYRSSLYGTLSETA